MKWVKFLQEKAEEHQLTDRQKEIFLSWLEDKNNHLTQRRMGEKFSLTRDTIAEHLENICAKFSGSITSTKLRKNLITEYEKNNQSPALQLKLLKNNLQAQSVSESLWYLDYDDQEAEFKKCLKKLNPDGAFLIRAGQTKLQKWLVKRLAYKYVPNFERAEKISICITRKGTVKLTKACQGRPFVAG
jgi:DNA-binding CsgD family transcriptional regulator